MIPNIQAGLKAILDRENTTHPQHVNRISGLDDPCERRLYYARVDWDKAKPKDTGLMGVLKTGSTLEPVIERIVSEAGAASDPLWRIVGQQMPTNDDFLQKWQISGTVDGFLQTYDGPTVRPTQFNWLTRGVVDIKTCSPNIYPRLNCYDDLALYPWTRAWRGQLQLYAIAHDMEDCYILLVNKQNLYDMKFIHFKVDMDYVEGLLKKAERTNKAIEHRELPAQLSDPDVCPKCQWFSWCTPDIETGGNLGIVDNEELASVLDAMYLLEPHVADHKKLESQRDQMLVKGQDMVVGNWIIQWKKTINGHWRKTIKRMKGD
jgi:hypothetical protein